jgi:hypothetical protein
MMNILFSYGELPIWENLGILLELRLPQSCVDPHNEITSLAAGGGERSDIPAKLQLGAKIRRIDVGGASWCRA